MSKSVKIPTNMNPFLVEVNGKKYSYPAGTTQTVPDDVAAVIENLNHNTPKPDPEASNFPSFNDLRDRPFGDLPTGGDTLTWDGNTEGLTYVDPDGQGLMVMFRISDAVPTKGDFPDGCKFEVYMKTDSVDALYAATQHDNATVQSLFLEDGFAAFGDEGVLIAPYDGYETGGGVLPKKGIYAVAVYSPMGTLYLRKFTIPGYTGFPSTKKLDSKYLPGAVILYADAESYLYATEDTSDTSKRITKAELVDMMQSGRSIYIYFEADGAKGHTLCAMFEVTSFEYGVVQTGMGHTLYTAEYTG